MAMYLPLYRSYTNGVIWKTDNYNKCLNNGVLISIHHVMCVSITTHALRRKDYYNIITKTILSKSVEVHISDSGLQNSCLGIS